MGNKLCPKITYQQKKTITNSQKQVQKPSKLPALSKMSQQTSYQNKTSQEEEYDQNQIQQYYQKLTQGNQQMSDLQLFNFLGAQLQINDNDPVTGFILIHIMKVQRIQSIHFEHFKRLFLYNKTSKSDKIKANLHQVQQEASLQNNRKHTYLNLFGLYSGNKSTIDFETAQLLWGVYLRDIMEFHKQFMSYLAQMQDKQSKKVHKDLWNMMYQFSKEVKNLQKYSQDDGWPLLIDNFIEFTKKKS